MPQDKRFKNRFALSFALACMMRAREILQEQGSVVAEDLDEPIKQLSEQIKELMK